MTPDALKVATDILRELGMDDCARWVEHPEAVRRLLESDQTYGEREHFCSGCGADSYDAHKRCPVTAAWRAIGDPRGQADIERAHEEALESSFPLLCAKGRTEQGYHPCNLPENHRGACEGWRGPRVAAR